MSKPRILLVSAVPDFKGGAEIVILSMLDNPYIEPVLATPEDGPLAAAARKKGVPVTFYHPTALLAVHRPPSARKILAAVADAFRCAARLRRIMREQRCDIVHSHGLKPHALLVILSLLWRVPTVVHMHDIAYSRAERLIWRMIALFPTRMILVSRPCYPGARLPSNVVVIPNGITTNYPALSPKTDLNVPLRIGFVGRFTANKGMDLLIDWFQAVRAAVPQVTLTLRGRPDPDVPEYWEHIKDRIATEGLSDVIHHQGWLARDALYDDLDVLMVPSHRPDPGPLVVAEAMSAGVVVIGYPAGGIPFAIDHGKTGLLCRQGEDVAQSLSALVQDPSEFLQIRSAAYQKTLTVFSIQAFHQRIAELYANILRKSQK